MVISDPTRELYAEAHRLGDLYYRQAGQCIRTSGHINSDCRQTGSHYLDALERLLAHLTTVGQSRDVEQMRDLTAGYIDIVKGELVSEDEDVH